MAFSDPVSISYDGAAVNLPRTGSSGTTGQFTSGDQRFKFVVAHNKGRRTQHVARLEFADIVSNPLIPTQNYIVSAAATLTVNMPLNGVTTEQATDLADALVLWATPTNVAKLLGGEN